MCIKVPFIITESIVKVAECYIKNVLTVYVPVCVYCVESIQHQCPVPQPIQQVVQKQNLEFYHNKSHFNYSYYQFIKQLLTINFNYIRQQIELNTGIPSVSCAP